MKKRIVCAILSLILLVSIIPANALTASAATRKVSESAITVLKQLQKYRSTCNEKGYIGYGTKCTEKVTKKVGHGDTANPHKISEPEADKALRKELESIDKSVNGFASANGLSLSQCQHDALVLFSFRNGTAWMSGTGDVKRAVTTRASGNEFLNMFVNWQSGDNNERRLIEANMYLNGIYSTTVPTRYIQVTFDANGGTLAGSGKPFYYDYTISETELPTPTRDGYVFKGWYNSKPTNDAPNPDNWVHKLTSKSDGLTLYAYWQPGSADEFVEFKSVTADIGKANYFYISSDILATNFLYDIIHQSVLKDEKTGKATVSGNLRVVGEGVDKNGVKWYKIDKAEYYTYTKNGETTEKENYKLRDDYCWVKTGLSSAGYTMPSSILATSHTYDAPNGESRDDEVSGDLKVTSEFIDSEGVKWCKISWAEKYTYTDKKDKTYEEKNYSLNGEYWVKTGVSISGGGTGASGLNMDVEVTVTNSYVNSRVNATIHSNKNGSYSQGAKLRIIDTADADGFLWGQVAKSANDATAVGWVALMYTNYSEVAGKNDSGSTGGEVIAKARINVGEKELADGSSKVNNAYVNVRKSAGTDSQIVGALTSNTMVDIYETKYVNGHQWGRCKQGWFLLAYADVTWLVDNTEDETSQIGFASYAFAGKIYRTNDIYKKPTKTSEKVDISKLDESKSKLENNDRVVVTNVTVDGSGMTWGKIPQGWIVIYGKGTDVNFYDMEAAKFEVVADTASVREGPGASYERTDTLSKGTEFDVTKICVTEDTIWGYSDKIWHTAEGDNRTYSGWVNLSSRYVKRNNAPSGITIPTEDGPTGLVATVINADSVNARAGADIYRNVVCKVNMGSTYEVMEGPVNGWYRLKITGKEDQDTWVYQQYLDVKSGSTGSSSGSGSTGGTVETGKGIIANTYSGVNMRQTPGTAGAFMGKIQTGTSVEIYEVKQVGSSKWGKLTVGGKTGWVCMDYVTMISYEDIPGYSGSDGTSGSTGGSGSNTVTGSQTAIYTGTVKKLEDGPKTLALDDFSVDGKVTEDGRLFNETTRLAVFKTTDINSEIVRILENGDPVTIHEVLTVVEEKPDEDDSSSEYDGNNQGGQTDGSPKQKTMYWARTNDGYIRSPGNNIRLDALDEATYTVVDQDKVYIYDNYALTKNTIVDVEKDETVDGEDLVNGQKKAFLEKGDQVTVTEVEIVGNVISGKVEDNDGTVGWVNLSKLSKGAIAVKKDTSSSNNNNNNNSNNNNNNNNSPVIGDTGNTGSGGFVENAGGYKYTGKVINTNEVNVRSTASQYATKTAVLKSGASLVIYETTISEGMAWGRCDAGWVYLYYVDLTPATGSAVDARVVYNDNTIIYTDSACSETAGTYARMSVIDIYEVVGKMARTDKGWVNTDNLL